VGGNFVMQGTAREKGNYSVSGNVVYLTNRTETWEDAKNASKSYTDKSFADTKYAIRFNSDGNLFLDSYGSDGSVITSTIKYYKAG